jgi:hypothetical protein
MPEGVDYEAVLADLKARRQALDTAIAAIEALAAGALTPPSVLPGTDAKGSTVHVRPGSFHLMSVPEAIMKYLGMVNEPRTPNDIVAALNEGGHDRANYTNVYTALKRLRTAGQVTKLKNGAWDLLARYRNDDERA